MKVMCAGLISRSWVEMHVIHGYLRQLSGINPVGGLNSLIMSSLLMYFVVVESCTGYTGV